MSDVKKERMLEWLRDAHAAEQQSEQMLKGTASRLEHYPQFKARIEQHIEETRSQAGLLEGCIERLGGSTSAIKDTGGKMMGLGQAFSGVMVGDEVVKAAMSSYAFENMEIASYKILIAAAEEVDDMYVKDVCSRILKEEEAMSAWLDEHMEQITRRYLELENDPNAKGKH